ncbi:MAG: hypothetical protein SLRJCFUN_000393 [Candidatus Fervidibacter sp.]
MLGKSHLENRCGIVAANSRSNRRLEGALGCSSLLEWLLATSKEVRPHCPAQFPNALVGASERCDSLIK